MVNTIEFESKVLKEWHETPEIKAYHFSVPKDFSFQSAQHVAIGLKIGEKMQQKAFSIASAPSSTHAGYIEVAKRIGTSEYAKKLDNLRVGDTVHIKGPYGRFLLDESKDAVMLCGGIGITPLKNMIEHACEKKLPIKITLLCSNRTLEDIPYKKEFIALEKRNRNFRAMYTLTRPQEGKSAGEWKGLTGRISKEMISSIGKFGEKIYYICGPSSMVNALLSLLKGTGIQDEQIKLERFTGYNGEE